MEVLVVQMHVLLCLPRLLLLGRCPWSVVLALACHGACRSSSQLSPLSML